MSNQSHDVRSFLSFIDSDEVKAFREDFAEAPARSATILGLALIEDQLRVLLDKATIPRAGMKSFSDDRSWTVDELNSLASRFGLITEPLHSAIRTLAQIRNRFAHEWNVTLDWNHPKIKSLIGNLEYQQEVIKSAIAGHPDITEELRWRGTIGAVIGSLHSAQNLASAPEEAKVP